jgi:methyltransferase (TIGR00027 family)
VFKESLAAGATQVVILGAGLDSRAYRFGDLLRGARVFEVDFPPTQEYKKKRVREILKGLPPHVAYAPIDFTKEDLATVLRQAGYDTTKKTVFVWEGVTLYTRDRREWNARLRRIEFRARQSNRFRLLPGECT